MKHDIDEVIIAAFISHEPVVIVEGQDDIKFYSNIAVKNECHVNIQAVETIEGYVEGCEGVINAMEDVQRVVEADSRLEKYILGVIDRDARYYMHTIPELNNLLVLNYYSYESHLVTNKSILKLLGIMTKASRDLLTDEVADFLKVDFESNLTELYYFSLEALKARCDTEYEACISCGDKPGGILGHGVIERYWNQILPKKDSLDQFADEIGTTRSDVRKIANGKWYLYCWCKYIIQKSKELYQWCGTKLPKCVYCEIGQSTKCLWRQESIFQIPNIKSILYSEEIIDLDEVRYITDRMKELAS